MYPIFTFVSMPKLTRLHILRCIILLVCIFTKLIGIPFYVVNGIMKHFYFYFCFYSLNMYYFHNFFLMSYASSLTFQVKFLGSHLY